MVPPAAFSHFISAATEVAVATRAQSPFITSNDPRESGFHMTEGLSESSKVGRLSCKTAKEAAVLAVTA